MKWPRSPFERFEEWWFKLGRTDLFQVFNDEVDVARRFRELVEKTGCPACKQKNLELTKFERGPKGWEADLKCGHCNFNGVVSRLSTVFLEVNSKGQAVTKTRRRSKT